MKMTENPSLVMAIELKPGDRFRVSEHKDPECSERVCLTNDHEHGLRFGFPNKPGYWCYMGERVVVELLPKEKRETGDV